MKKVSFYFTRHAYSCANLLKKTSIFKLHKIIKDPHISDIGVTSSLKMSKQIKKIKYNHIFVSPLIRTWETLLCMYDFSKTARTQYPYSRCLHHTVYVAPYISEHNKINIPIVTLDNSPYQYSTQLDRLKLFKRYMSLKYKIKYPNKFKPKYRGIYTSKYTSGGNITKFIQWYINTYKIKKRNNVLIISHGDVLRQFLKKIFKLLYNKNNIPLTIRHNNNFIFKLTLSYDTAINNILNNNDIFTLYKKKIVKLSCKIINHGIKTPSLNEIKHIKVPFMKTKKLSALKDISLCDLY